MHMPMHVRVHLCVRMHMPTHLCVRMHMGIMRAYRSGRSRHVCTCAPACAPIGLERSRKEAGSARLSVALS